MVPCPIEMGRAGGCRGAVHQAGADNSWTGVALLECCERAPSSSLPPPNPKETRKNYLKKKKEKTIAGKHRSRSPIGVEKTITGWQSLLNLYSDPDIIFAQKSLNLNSQCSGCCRCLQGVLHSLQMLILPDIVCCCCLVSKSCPSLLRPHGL